MHKKLFFVKCLIGVLVVSGFFWMNALSFGTVHASSDVSGILTSDTTWTKSGSPYSLTGPVAVNNGITLTVEPGVTVNLNGFYIRVNGTLTARGTDNDKVSFNGGEIVFTSVSTGWSEQSGSGSILENAVVDSLATAVSVKVTKCTVTQLSLGGGASMVSYSSIGSLSVGDASTITNSDLSGTITLNGSPTVTFNNIDGRPWVRSGSPVISNNKISDGVHCDAAGGDITLSHNEIRSKNNFTLILVAGTHADITDNVLIGSSRKSSGITVGGVLSSASISRNQIYSCQTGISVDQCSVQISKNVIADCDLGLKIVLHEPLAGASPPWSDNPVVNAQANTIARNDVGVLYQPYVLTSTIANNNIYDNSQYNFKLQQFSGNLTVANNWWGTTDTAAIEQSIYDFDKDFDLGSVSFTPFLTAPNPDAPAIPDSIPTPAPASTPTPAPATTPTPTTSTSPSESPTATPEQPSTQPGLSTTETAIIIALIIIAVIQAVTLVLVLKKKR